MKTNKKNLLLIAGIIWFIAGVNVCALGVTSLIHMVASPLLNFALALVGVVIIFVAFHAMFSKLARKNGERIRSLADKKHSPFLFMDAKGYFMMALMMSCGFGLRLAGIIPSWFVAFFYTGLGAALALAGFTLAAHWVLDRPLVFHKRPGLIFRS